jgi:hypothetical protein
MTKKIELLNQEPPREVIEKTYVLRDGEGVLIYKEWTDKKTGVLVDSLLRSKHGYEIQEYELYASVQEFVENLEEQSNQNTMQLSNDDVLQVARELNVELNNVQIKEILKRYEDEQANDPTATWNLVIENLIYNL